MQEAYQKDRVERFSSFQAARARNGSDIFSSADVGHIYSPFLTSFIKMQHQELQLYSQLRNFNLYLIFRKSPGHVYEQSQQQQEERDSALFITPPPSTTTSGPYACTIFTIPIARSDSKCFEYTEIFIIFFLILLKKKGSSSSSFIKIQDVLQLFFL
jgi:hypothetical protein